MREEGMAGRDWLSFVRRDIALAYVFTAVFAVAIMVVATAAFDAPGVAITNAQAMTRMAEALGDTIGPVGFYAYAMASGRRCSASLLGVWQKACRICSPTTTGCCAATRRPARQRLTRVRARGIRLACFFITTVSLPFAFVDQPLFSLPHLHHRRQPVHPVPGRRSST